MGKQRDGHGKRSETEPTLDLTIPLGMGEVYEKLYKGEATGIALTPQETGDLLDYIDWLVHRRGGRVLRHDPRFQNEFCARYREPHRRYHNIQHIEACFDIAEDFIPKEVDRQAIDLAILAHDVIYDTMRGDNEEKSAFFFEECALRYNIDPKLTSRVSSIILATKHTGQDESALPLEARYMLDVDMSILGAVATEFDAYCANIRAEYHWVPEDIYRAKRKEILEGFLARDRIYLTDVFHVAFEEKARGNLQRAIQSLSAPTV